MNELRSLERQVIDAQRAYVEACADYDFSVKDAFSIGGPVHQQAVSEDKQEIIGFKREALTAICVEYIVMASNDTLTRSEARPIADVWHERDDFGQWMQQLVQDIEAWRNAQKSIAAAITSIKASRHAGGDLYLSALESLGNAAEWLAMMQSDFGDERSARAILGDVVNE